LGEIAVIKGGEGGGKRIMLKRVLKVMFLG
jgi:hypothetical protein